jgi:hypothetical protein
MDIEALIQMFLKFYTAPERYPTERKEPAPAIQPDTPNKGENAA